jgi:hypothetical protein
MLTVLLLGMLTLAFNIETAKTEPEAVSEVLQSHTVECIYVYSNGSCRLTIDMEIKNETLSDVYRSAFDFWGDGFEDIPQNVASYYDVQPKSGTNPSYTVSADGEPTTSTWVECRDQFLGAVEQEQLLRLGVKITKWTKNQTEGAGEVFWVHLEAEAELQLESSGGTSKILVGPKDLNASYARAEFLLTRIGFIQQMLGSFSGTQEYRNTWDTHIHLEPPLLVNNTQELTQMLPWYVDFGGGTEMEAWIDNASAEEVCFTEVMTVNETEITATAEDLLEKELLCHKVFNIEVLNAAWTSYHSATLCYDDWSYHWNLQVWQGKFKMDFEDYDINLTLDTELNLEGKIGWKFGWFKLKRFESWIKLNPFLNVTFEATGIYDKYWTLPFLDLSITYSFFVGPVPVWADLTFSASANLDINIASDASVTFYGFADGGLTAGVGWKRHGGNYAIFRTEVDCDGTAEGALPSSVDMEITPSVVFELGLYFYSIAGPRARFIPYVRVTVDKDSGYRCIKVGLNVTAGIGFSGYIEIILGLSGWDWTLWNRVFWSDPPGADEDVEVINVRAPMQAFVGETVPICVDVLNKGNTGEAVSVTLSYKDTHDVLHNIGVDEKWVSDGRAQTYSFNWTTYWFLEHWNYTLEAEAEITTGSDDNPSDNTGNCSVVLDIQDIAVVDVDVVAWVSGSHVDINVNVSNIGTGTVSTVMALVYYSPEDNPADRNPISDTWCGYINLTFNLTADETATLHFRWWTVKNPNNYIIWAKAPPLPYETNIGDNTWPHHYVDVSVKDTMSDVAGWLIADHGAATIKTTPAGRMCPRPVPVSITVTRLDDETLEGHPASVNVYISLLGLLGNGMHFNTTYVLLYGQSDSVEVQFNWTELWLSPDVYNMTGLCYPEAEDTDPSNNWDYDGLVQILGPCDGNGDNVVSLDDLLFLIEAFWSTPSAANWDWSYDVDCDNDVDLDDLLYLINYFWTIY